MSHPTPSDHSLDQTSPFLLFTNMSTLSLSTKGFLGDFFTAMLMWVLHALRGDLERREQIYDFSRHFCLPVSQARWGGGASASPTFLL